MAISVFKLAFSLLLTSYMAKLDQFKALIDEINFNEKYAKPTGLDANAKVYRHDKYLVVLGSNGATKTESHDTCKEQGGEEFYVTDAAMKLDEIFTEFGITETWIDVTIKPKTENPVTGYKRRPITRVTGYVIRTPEPTPISNEPKYLKLGKVDTGYQYEIAPAGTILPVLCIRTLSFPNRAQDATFLQTKVAPLLKKMIRLDQDKLDGLWRKVTQTWSALPERNDFDITGKVINAELETGKLDVQFTNISTQAKTELRELEALTDSADVSLITFRLIDRLNELSVLADSLVQPLLDPHLSNSQQLARKGSDILIYEEKPVQNTEVFPTTVPTEITTQVPVVVDAEMPRLNATFLNKLRQVMQWVIELKNLNFTVFDMALFGMQVLSYSFHALFGYRLYWKPDRIVRVNTRRQPVTVRSRRIVVNPVVPEQMVSNPSPSIEMNPIRPVVTERQVARCTPCIQRARDQDADELVADYNNSVLRAVRQYRQLPFIVAPTQRSSNR